MKKVVLAAAVACILISTDTWAAPPPAPPEYVLNASKALSGLISQESVSAFGALFAPDVVVHENGELIARDRGAWLLWAKQHLATDQRQVIGYSESSGGYSKRGGELLVVDEVNTVDRSNLPPSLIADPRLKTRTFLYQFANDGLIHAVRISSVGGFWTKVH